MSERYLKSIKAIGIHGRYSFIQNFHAGVNILYGLNGTGKTTFLHIVSNLLNGDLERFAYIKFKSIEAELSDETRISILSKQIDKVRSILVEINGQVVVGPLSIKEIRERETPYEIRDLERRPSPRLVQMVEEHEKASIKIDSPLSVAYFPAFRTMIEAWASAGGKVALSFYNPYSKRYARLQQTQNTLFARQLFGEFVPKINYPSPLEIEIGLASEMQDAVSRAQVSEGQYLNEIVPNIVRALSNLSIDSSEDSEEILVEIDSLFTQLEEHPLSIESGLIDPLRDSVRDLQINQAASSTIAVRILDIYREALKKVVSSRQKAFESIEKYLDSVNFFLTNESITSKKISIDTSETKLFRANVQIEFDDGTPSLQGIGRALSSGERQIVTLIYAATHMSKQEVVLIDEPEISLHVDWQHPLIKKMAEQLGDRQIIACTHSPVIGVDYEDQIFEFEPYKYIAESEDDDISSQEDYPESSPSYDDIPF